MLTSVICRYTMKKIRNEEELIQVGVIETTKSPSGAKLTENFQSNFGLVGHSIYTSNDYPNYVFVFSEEEDYPYLPFRLLKEE